ncbi:3-carboxy-cis,cis-mucoante lactonizing enzyme [Mycena indigotica]|uniref:3-carboxy-cis,cis-mucoante lactonizing enzyme n=1 Tax=Mycena indigotica TaxID=2126181 RepID=A0A8H6T3L3_9AGAR|nr:3-carboxy-cis,cis-mucoante lactonizing enzyme [Mycena indigotica]KAF7309727.1 3-carboxy-cis,cis-mucoante lactonizing enzyme [Mycena indigotica]
MSNRILVASYTSSIFTLSFDASQGSLVLEGQVEVGFHPSWITQHPADKSLVFAGLEQTDGKVVAVKYDGDKANIVSTASSGGEDPCSLLATESELFVANYSSGSISIIPIASTPPYLLPGSVVTQLYGQGPNDQRQQGPHAHQVLLDDSQVELLVADLGSDRVCRFTKDEYGGWILQAYIHYTPGSGPRHLAIHDGALYTLLELSSTLSKHRFHGLPATPVAIAEKPTMSNPPTPPHDMLAAELLIPKPNASFPTAYAYVSNRNDPSEEGDTIAIFGIEGETLELVAEVRTGLKHLRGMVFGGPDDKWLVAGGANGGGVKVFERVDGGRGLKEIAANSSVDSPTGFLWV